MSAISSHPLPPTSRALVCAAAGEPLSVETVSTPQPTPGSVVVHVINSSVEGALAHLIKGGIPGLAVPEPFVPGAGAIARVAAIGIDTTSLKVGQLVLVDSFIRGRDNPDVQIIWGAGVFGGDPRAIKLMEDVWRNGTSAEYIRVPLENCYPLNEERLLGNPGEGALGYTPSDLAIVRRHIIGYAGLRGINLKAGETIIVAPATGAYSGAVVDVASALGARVIAVSRNLNVLQKIASVNPRVNIVQVKGNVEEDLASIQKFGPVDAFLDISPWSANASTHIRSCLMAVKPYGRVSLMGVLQNDIALPYVTAVLKNITIRGQYMYEREDVRDIIKLIESGVLKFGKSHGHEIVGEFELEDWEKAVDAASKNTAAGKVVLFKISNV